MSTTLIGRSSKPVGFTLSGLPGMGSAIMRCSCSIPSESSGSVPKKQICDSYLLPRQTMNNVITRMRKDGLLEYSSAHSIGREKAFVLSEKGTGYIAPLLASLEGMETGALELLGDEKLAMLTGLLSDYNKALCTLWRNNRNKWIRIAFYGKRNQ